MSNNNILFDANSGAMDSPVFMLDKQITVIATGMAPDDYITFEVLQLLSGDPAKLCGCRLTAASMATIELVKPLTCSMCGPEGNSQEVRLTDNNTFVILDAPQGALLRAIYHGTGVDDGTAKVWYNTSDTPDLNDAMRGCSPIETWEDTGVTRCGDTNLEVQQQSSCGAIRWEDGAPLNWSETANRRCVSGGESNVLEVQEVNDCGTTRWAEVGTFEWTITGVYDCSGSLVMQQRTNPCGDIEWLPIPEGDGSVVVAWLPTGVTSCGDTTISVQERNQCGDIRWSVGEPLVWVPTGEVQCIPEPRLGDMTDVPTYTVSTQEVNPCGGLRWIHNPTIVEMVYTTDFTCIENAGLIISYIDACGSFAVQAVLKTEDEYWTPTGNLQCGEEITQREERDACGNTRWIDDPSGEPTWFDVGDECAHRCDPDTGFLFRAQRNRCCNGSERWVQVFEPDGVTPVEPEWLSTGTFRCNEGTGMVELQDRSQCNTFRWTECSEIIWTATGDVRIYSGNSQLQESNPCGETRWRDIPPESINWTLTGVQACVNGFFHNQETDGFGNTRTTITTEPCGCTGNPVLEHEFDTDWVTYTGRRGKPGFGTTTFTYAHGLGVEPDFVTFEFRCIVAQGGYSAGDVVVANVHSADQQGGVSTGWAIRKDSTAVYLAFDYNSGASLHQWNDKQNFRLANNYWAFRIRGYA